MDIKAKLPEKQTGKKVAVIGGGPAGITAAYELAMKVIPLNSMKKKVTSAA